MLKIFEIYFYQNLYKIIFEYRFWKVFHMNSQTIIIIIKMINILQGYTMFKSHHSKHFIHRLGLHTVYIITDLLHMRFDVLTEESMSMFLFWVVTPCGLVGRHQRFGWIYGLKIDAVSSSETLVSSYKPTRRYDSEFKKKSPNNRTSLLSVHIRKIDNILHIEPSQQYCIAFFVSVLNMQFVTLGCKQIVTDVRSRGRTFQGVPWRN
jgi:hypothetical protein